jgi:phospholipase/carboxylesterase
MTRGDAARLTARPGAPTQAPPGPGDHRLGIGATRDVTLFVPARYAVPAPLVLCLHGAGGNAKHRIDPLRPFAERAGALLVAPDSVGSSWDVLYGGFGPDIARIEEALEIAFARFAVDPARVAIEGFSDGASYALSLGLTNGDLFRRIVAFSPGFNAAVRIVNHPRVLVTHGIWDHVLPVACSRRIVPRLREAGLDVEYHEFRGLHVVPKRFVREAFASL